MLKYPPNVSKDPIPVEELPIEKTESSRLIQLDSDEEQERNAKQFERVFAESIVVAAPWGGGFFNYSSDTFGEFDLNDVCRRLRLIPGAVRICQSLITSGRHFGGQPLQQINGICFEYHAEKYQFCPIEVDPRQLREEGSPLPPNVRRIL